MTIGERVLSKIDETGMSRKEFSEKTGIAQSTISEWKSKKTNPVSDKIMIICNTLNVTPQWLLSGSDNNKKRGKKSDCIVVDRNSELGFLVTNYNDLDEKSRNRLIGYITALSDTKKKK